LRLALKSIKAVVATTIRLQLDRATSIRRLTSRLGCCTALLVKGQVSMAAVSGSAARVMLP